MENIIWIHAGWIIDGSGRSIQRNVLLKIRNGLNEFGRQTPPQFNSKELRQAVRAAQSRQLRVMVHANRIAASV